MGGIGGCAGMGGIGGCAVVGGKWFTGAGRGGAPPGGLGFWKC